MSKKIDATIKEYNRIMDKFMDAIIDLPVGEQFNKLLNKCSKYNICPENTIRAIQKQKRNSQSSEEEPMLTK